jgi:hypothetical protein
MPHLPQEELPGGDGRAHTVAPGRIADLTASREDGCGWQPPGLLAGHAWQDGRAVRNHLMTSRTIRLC